MSNPCINRWGLNAYWHHYWYSDIRYASNAHQDTIYLQLLQLYLTYGLNTPLTTFHNTFWHKTTSLGLTPNDALKSQYRWVTLYNPTLQSAKKYRLRQENEEVFQSKISVLKFNSWLVINLYWFQPNKTKLLHARRAASVEHINTTLPQKSSNLNVKKLRTLTSRLVSTTSRTSSRYSF